MFTRLSKAFLIIAMIVLSIALIIAPTYAFYFFTEDDGVTVAIGFFSFLLAPVIAGVVLFPVGLIVELCNNVKDIRDDISSILRNSIKNEDTPEETIVVNEPEIIEECWTCKKCGDNNPMRLKYCKGCGEYR